MENIVNKMLDSSLIHEAIVCVETEENNFCWSKDKTIDSPILLASVTKLFTTACILALQNEGKLSLECKISNYLNADILQGLHIYKNTDYSQQLTIKHLLFQTSGLPDASAEGKNSFMNKAAMEHDFSYTFNDILQATKVLRPHFAPGTPNKAYYADINFDLLGKIVEIASSLTLHDAYKKYIATPLQLENTYLASGETDAVPPIFHKNKALHLEKFIRSSGASGGAISTARELMIFIKAFWQGRLFPQDVFSAISHYNSLQVTMMPICYAGGYMRLGAGYPFTHKIEVLGHTGVTGSFAFYVPAKKMFMVGDLNQLSRPDFPVRLVMKLSMENMQQ